MTRLSLGLVLATLVAAPVVGAQTPVTARAPGTQSDSLRSPRLPMLRSVAAAEEEGRLLPQGAAKWVQVGFRQTVGPSDRSCATVPRNAFADDPVRAHAAGTYGTEIRTGDFTVTGDIGRMFAGREAKVPWVPRHHPYDTLGLLVRAARLGPDAQLGDTVRFTSPNRGVTPHFFPTAFMLPTAGIWLVVATSGIDWGCLIVPVG